MHLVFEAVLFRCHLRKLYTIFSEISPSAQAIQSVNTIVNERGFLRAYNTDYIAIVKLIKEYQLDKKSRVIVRAVVVWLKRSSRPLKTADLSI